MIKTCEIFRLEGCIDDHLCKKHGLDYICITSLQFELTSGLVTNVACTVFGIGVVAGSQLAATLMWACNMLIGLWLQYECDFGCIFSIRTCSAAVSPMISVIGARSCSCCFSTGVDSQ